MTTRYLSLSTAGAISAPAVIVQVFDETPSGTMNGSNTSFTFATAPTVGSVRLYYRGIRQRLTTDFTFSSTTLTLTFAPLSGESLVADYTHL